MKSLLEEGSTCLCAARRQVGVDMPPLPDAVWNGIGLLLLTDLPTFSGTFSETEATLSACGHAQAGWSIPGNEPTTTAAEPRNGTIRWYDPITGRFISKDPSGIANGLNQYVALNNNPVNFVDPTGESAIEAADYWASMAGSGYNQGGFSGWWKVQTGNTMGMFINMWHAQEMEEHAGLAGEYWDECKGKSAKHMAAVGGYAVLDYVQFTGLQKLGGLTGEGRQGTRIFQLRNKATGRPVFRLDKGPVPGKVGPKLHYHRPPNLKLHHPYQGGL